MAISNRERVDRGLQIMAEGLAPFIDRSMSEAAPDGNWMDMLRARDEVKFGAAKKIDSMDPGFLLRVLTEEIQVFKKYLSKPESAFASELRETRNRWAHNEAFSADDTSRALDTMERLLKVVGAPDQAEEVRRIRTDLQKVSSEAEARKVIKSQTDAGVNLAVAGL
jgi:hypothetical protein